ncbi:MAG TPA: cytochrome c-type biogenesis protein CcmH [Acidimicrobiia bacterium]|nr:cytochrome c-type biogenesis protein CcmH [Acidimicrobiia bacterium]
MSERARNIASVTVIAVLAVALIILTSTRPATVDRVEQIGTRIKCPVCQGESIANSPSQMAEDMMDLVSERVASGVPDEQIVDELLGSYTGAVLLDPPTSGSTLVLWLAPVVALALGIAVILWWRRHPGPASTAEPPSPGRSRTRLVIGGVVLILAFAGIVVVAANSLQDRPAAAAGAADIDQQDLSEVSNETMEAVIAANVDDPQINGMRLALAERYFDEGDYRSAFPHYLVVAEGTNSTGAEAITALVRLGWMAYDGNGEVETATRLIDEALAIDPESSVARYVKARVLWCGAGETEQAVETFEDLLADPDLVAETRAQVEADLALASEGGECP